MDATYDPLEIVPYFKYCKGGKWGGRSSAWSEGDEFWEKLTLSRVGVEGDGKGV